MRTVRYSACASNAFPVDASRPAEVVMVVRHESVKQGDGGVVFGQPLPDGERFAKLGLRL